jgi:nicotinamidase/pyrazinamidase
LSVETWKLKNRGLIVVDVQRDFCPGGALPAEAGHLIVPAINRHIAEARALGMPVYASRDWHPAVTKHFKAYGGEWPPHCVEDSMGAQFHPDLQLPDDAIVISKGDDPDRPGYSAFEGRTALGTSLLADLQHRQIDWVFVAGLTTEYCVRQTVLDARRAGLRVSVLLDAIGSIDQHPGDAERAVADMANAGAELILGSQLPGSDSPLLRENPGGLLKNPP